MPTIDELTTPMRHASDITAIAGRLNEVAAARFDVVAPQSSLTLTDFGRETNLHLPESLLTDSGVISGSIDAAHTRTAYRQIMGRLGIPLKYADKLAAGDATWNDLLCDNVNTLARSDDRTAMYRYLQADDGMILRAVVSDMYGVIDGDQAWTAILKGLMAADIGLGDCEVTGDVTTDRLAVRIAVPTIAAFAPDLFGDYRFPFSMNPSQPVHAAPLPGETPPPALFAGLEFRNSDTGGGKYTISPRAIVPICRNGLTKEVAFSRAHFGERMDEGVIQWSDETRRTMLDLITNQVSDAVRTFCSVEYLEGLINDMRAAKGVAVDQPNQTVEVVQNRYGFSDTETENVLACFMRGGDPTVLGIGQAVTAAAQLSPDTDRQAEMEATFWQIVEAPAELVA